MPEVQPSSPLMVQLDAVSVLYPEPPRLRDLILHPTRPRARRPALTGVSLSVPEARSLAILGVNGAGKTTLLRLVAGLLYPTEGNVFVNGLDTEKARHLLRARVGHVINEERSFYWRLTGSQNLAFFGALHDLHGRALRERIAALLHDVGLSSAAHVRVSHYSAGMRQRLALARGLLTDPLVLLLDEPTKNLDPLGARQIRELIVERIGPARKVLIVATNQLDDLFLCDEFCVLSRGNLVTRGHSTDLPVDQIHDLLRSVAEAAQ